MADPVFVYILWHGDDVSEETPEPELLGVYSTEAGAKDRVARCLRDGVPGFTEHPDDFLISRYELNKDEWVQGYVKVE